MTNETEINILLKCRSQIEGEITNLQDALATKKKAHASLSDTIDLLRGWHPVEVTVISKRASYDRKAIEDAILDYFSASVLGSCKIEEVCKYLQDHELIPSYSTAVRTTVSRFMKEMGVLDTHGHGPHAKWFVKKA